MHVHPVYRLVCFAAKMMFRELFDGDIYGNELIPTTGPCLLACNHASYFDPPFIGSAVHNREVFSMAKSELFRTPFRNWLFCNMNCVPVHRGTGDVGAIKSALRLLQDGKCVMIFPEGTRSEDGTAQRAQAGVGMLACKTEVPVVPCHIMGTFEIMKKHSKGFDWNRKATIIFGQPLLPEDYKVGEKKELYQNAASIIMERVYSLRPQVTRDVY